MKYECEECGKIFDDRDIIKAVLGKSYLNGSIYGYYCEKCYYKKIEGR